MARPFVTITSMAALLGNDRDQLIRAAKQFDLETFHVRTKQSRGNLTLAISPDDAKLILARFAYLVEDLEVDPADLLPNVPQRVPAQSTAAPAAGKVPEPPKRPAKRPTRPKCGDCGGMMRTRREHDASGSAEITSCLSCGRAPPAANCTKAK